MAQKKRRQQEENESQNNGRPRPRQEILLENGLAALPDSIKAEPGAPQRYDIETNLMRRDGAVGRRRKLSWLFWSFPFMHLIRRDIVRSFRSVAENPSQPRLTIPPQLLDDFEAKARQEGIGAVGYTPLPAQAVFAGKGVLFEQVIVLIMEMDKEKMAQAPSRTTFRMVMETYYELGRIIGQLVDFLRDHGIAAQAGHPLNGETLYPLVAQQAGLGWCGSNGLLITPEFGPRQRIGLIYTNIQNLPAAAANEHGWIADLCARCQQCVRLCPSQAIYGAPVKKDLGIETHIDVDKCFPVFANQYGCSLCIKVCPFNLHPYEHIKRKFLKLAA